MTPPSAAQPDADGPDPDPAELSYEQAREQLTDIVRRLEAGAGLEESLSLWERGEQLATVCQQRLDGALARIEARTSDADDEGTAEE